ncbi:MAG: SLC13 family permease, partial [Planctomycetota bacterium]
MSESALRSLHRRRLLLLLAGGLGTFLVSLLPGVAALEDPARATACVAFFTAWCWLTLALPLPVSALLPAVLLPASGAVSARIVAPSYFHDILLLFLGGFILALALERYGLHRRFALLALECFGVRPRRLVLGFMLVAGALSMFISNTSTALLMLPVALAVLEDCPEGERKRLSVPLLLGMAYACSIGGTATPIGTAPNAVFLGQLRDRFPAAPQIAFGTWFLGVIPFVLVFLLVTWLVLTYLLHPLSSRPLSSLDGVAKRRRAQGKRTPAQNRVLFVFGLVAILWLTRRGIEFGSWSLPGWSSLLPPAVAGSISDSTVALFGAILFFILPGDSRETGSLLGWKDCQGIPWGVLLLLGGGFALARAFESTGLSEEVGLALRPMVTALPPFALVLVVSLVVTFLTEITSNTATINVL